MISEKLLKLNGVVSSGVSQGSHFTALDWVVEQCNSMLGFIPYAGTLNLEVKATDYELWQILKLRVAGYILAPPTKDFCSARLIPGRLEGLGVAAVVPSVKGYPEDLIEILAPVPLRHRLKLKDGDTIAIAFPLPAGVG